MVGEAVHNLASAEKLYVRDYGNGDVECTWNLWRMPGAREKAARGEGADREGNQDRAIRRARKMISRKVMHSELTYLLTLTYRQNVVVLERARRDRERFCDLVQAEIPGWKYLGVYEKQERGAWHAHMAVKGWQDVNLLRELWWKVVGVGMGNVDVKAPKARKAKNGRVWMSKYIAKYVGKDLEELELNRKNYYHSKNVEDPPVQVVLFTPWDLGAEDYAGMIIKLRGGTPTKVWVSRNGWQGRVSSF